MRVLHISDSDGTAGASRAAFRIHSALRDAGVDSHMLVEYKQTRDPFVHPACGFRGFPGRLLFAIRGEIDLFPLRRYRHRLRAPWVGGWLPRGLLKQVKRLAPDVVHLHWMGTLAPIKELPDLGLPTLWSLHDSHAFTGGCCVPGECKMFINGCGNCPLLASGKQIDFSSWILHLKHRAWSNWPVKVVGLSKWITSRSQQSSLFKEKQHSTIANGVNIRQFIPHPQKSARKALGLPVDRRLLLFGAASLTDRCKGGSLLQDALNVLKNRLANKNLHVGVILFGRKSGSLAASLPFPVFEMGYVNEIGQLALLYSAADVIAVPSREDNCPQVPIESLACGTPVAAFNATGLKDLIDDGVTGRLAKPFDPVDLARIISELLQMNEPERLAMRERCRKVAVERFSIKRTAKQYLSLYEERLEKRTAL